VRSTDADRSRVNKSGQVDLLTTHCAGFEGDRELWLGWLGWLGQRGQFVLHPKTETLPRVKNVGHWLVENERTNECKKI